MRAMAMKYEYIFTLLFIMLLQAGVESVETSTATATSAATSYWKMKLPNTPLPALLEHMLPTSSGFDYENGRSNLNKDASLNAYSYGNDNYQASDEAVVNSKIFRSLFLQEEDLVKPSFRREMRFLGLADSGPPFMTRKEMEAQAPFGSHNNLSQVLSKFSINPTSREARLMNSTIAACEHSGPHLCVTSIEDMVDYVRSQFRSPNVEAIAVNVTPLMEVNRRYRIGEVSKLANPEDIIICHKATFPYGVFKCHTVVEGSAYNVGLESVDGQKVKVKVAAIVNCHDHTSAWNPRYGAFQLLDISPGHTVCHFLLGDSVVFLRKN